MGIATAFRRRGLGRSMLQRAIADARALGTRTITLEVIAENAAAIALYEANGFAKTRRLVGFVRGDSPAGAGVLEEIDPALFAGVVAREGDDDLPWQLSAATFAAATPPARAFRCGEAYALVVEGANIGVRGFVVARAHRRSGEGRRLFEALAGAFPGKAWSVSAVVPAGRVDAFAAALGFRPAALSQWEMALTL
jgi:GNAT superfamily N-acetyltransferase